MTWLRQRILPISIFVASLLITGLLWHHERRHAILVLHTQLDADLRDANWRIEQRIAAYSLMLRGAQGLFSTAEQIEQKAFQAYVDSLQLGADFSGVEGVGITLVVPHPQKAAHISSLLKQGFAEYAIKPEGKRDVYVPVMQLETFSGRNLRALGFDPYALATRRAAMDQSRDSGNVAITGKIKLVLETDSDVQSGFVMFLPLYKKGKPHDTTATRRANIIGWLHAPIRMNKFMSSLYGERASATEMSIYDGVEMTEQTLLYDSSGSQPTAENSGFQANEYLEIFGHTWTLNIRVPQGYESRLSKNSSSFIAISGISLSVVMILLTSNLVSGRERARKQTQALRETKEHFELIFNSSPDCTIITRMDDGCITNTNNGISVLGYTSAEVIGKTTLELNIWESENYRKIFTKELRGKGFCKNLEVKFRRKDGSIFTGYMSAKVTVLQGVQHIIGIMRDITEQQRAETELRLRGAALEATANAIIITDRKGIIEWANPAFCKLSGYTKEETLGQNSQELVSSGIQPYQYYDDIWNTILAGFIWHGEIVNRRKDGTLYHEDQTITPVYDKKGDITHFVSVKQDVTERKLNEARVRELSRHLLELQEGARRRLAGELHDRTSPNLAAIRINLDVMALSLMENESPELTMRLEDTRALIEDTNASIREICADLRPPVLDYAGLLAALESYAYQFSRRTGISVLVDCYHRSVRLSAELESALFRIAQEALTNCAKHARATSIKVTLDHSSRSIILTVADNGVGFDPDSFRESLHPGGLGVINMKELAEFFDGTFTLVSSPGLGTWIKVEIDLMKGRA